MAFESHLNEVWSSSKAKDIMKQIDWYTWLKIAGLPPKTANFTTQQANDATALAEAYIKGDGKDPSPKGYEKFKDWFSILKQRFILHLIESEGRVHAGIIAKIEADLQISSIKAASIRCYWNWVQISSRYQNAPYASAETFLGTNGRMKYINPVYKAINKVNPGEAKRIFAKYRSFYHPIAVAAVENIIGK